MKDTNSPPKVMHNEDKKRFELTIGGKTAVTEYMTPGNKIIFIDFDTRPRSRKVVLQFIGK